MSEYKQYKCTFCGREWGDVSDVCSGCLTNAWAKEMKKQWITPTTTSGC